jgi:nitroreductase
MSEIGLFEAMYSARALRRLKPDPVPDEIITQILDAAIHAPSAGNSQHWVFVVVRNPEVRHKLALIYRKGSDIAKAIYQARGRPGHMTEEQYQRMMASGAYLWEHMGDAPVLLVPCLRDRPAPPREMLPRRCRRSMTRSFSTPTGSAAPAFILPCRILFSPAVPSASAR